MFVRPGGHDDRILGVEERQRLFPDEPAHKRQGGNGGDYEQMGCNLFFEDGELDRIFEVDHGDGSARWCGEDRLVERVQGDDGVEMDFVADFWRKGCERGLGTGIYVRVAGRHDGVRGCNECVYVNL